MMVSANSETKDVLKGLENGANDYIRKPFQREDLHMRVQVSTLHLQSLYCVTNCKCLSTLTRFAGPYPHDAAV